MTDLIITDDLTLEQLQDQFNKHFEYLKIEFFKKSHKITEGSSPNELVKPDLIIGDIRTIHANGEISIHGNLKVSTLEENFEKYYGLHAQVFRRSGNVWLETTKTDDWTLAEQNKLGQEMSLAV